MKRITQRTKAIADAHIDAKKIGKFDDPMVKTKQELFAQLLSGKTFSGVVKEIEVRYVSITSNLMSSQLGHVSDAYVKGMYKGFKILLDKQ
jgi:hypothetical protein